MILDRLDRFAVDIDWKDGLSNLIFFTCGVPILVFGRSTIEASSEGTATCNNEGTLAVGSNLAFEEPVFPGCLSGSVPGIGGCPGRR